jgi:hypothetical protein
LLVHRGSSQRHTHSLTHTHAPGGMAAAAFAAMRASWASASCSLRSSR